MLQILIFEATFHEVNNIISTQMQSVVIRQNNNFMPIFSFVLSGEERKNKAKQDA
jgi:hypothetical protein